MGSNSQNERDRKKNGKKQKEVKVDYFTDGGRRYVGDEHNWRKLVADSWNKVAKRGDSKKKLSGSDESREEGDDDENADPAGGGRNSVQKAASKKLGDGAQKVKKDTFKDRLFKKKDVLAGKTK